MILNYAWLILLFPALGLLINGLFGSRLGRRPVAIIANAAVAGSLVMAFLLAYAVYTLPDGVHAVEVELWNWIGIAGLQVDMAFLLDPLSIVMILVVTGVGLVIHLYAAEYMKLDDHHQSMDDARYARFFAYLNLFILMMLVLVLANNYVMLYLGWEGVGLASYLLIGFWFHKPSAGDAAKKAFIVNRVGDFGLALAIFSLFALLGTQAGSLSFESVFHALESASPAAIAAMTGVTLLLLLAATGKSAQLPLFVWLPDAMEGPSPVSALIHAATMVTAGVYLIARSHPLFELAPTTMTIVAIVGALTALMAASIAVVQTDLKRILAYSTISQLGFMFVGVGMGLYVAAIFHLITHAFFKALLFLTAGSVMHGTHGELNIDKLGGLKRKMPTTYVQFLIGALTLAAFPLTAGYFSKDEILLGVFAQNYVLYGVMLFASLLTSFYIFRAVYRVFFGEPRDKDVYDHAHEQPRGMTAPLWILAAGSLLLGLIGIPKLLGEEIGVENINLLGSWLHPVFEGAAEIHVQPWVEYALFVSSGVAALLGIFIAYSRYQKNARWALGLQRVFSFLQPVLEAKYWIDEIYMKFIVRPLRAVSRFFASSIERIIDGVVNGVGTVTTKVGAGVAHLQTGYISWYALSLFFGVICVLGFFLLAN